MPITPPRKKEYRIHLENKFREVSRAGNKLMLENVEGLKECDLETKEYEECAEEFEELSRMKLDSVPVETICNMIYNIGFRCGSVKTLRIIAGNNRGNGDPQKESEQ